MLQLLSMMAQSSEFGQMAIREEELPELDALARDACHFDIKGGPENKHGKVNILLQASVAPRLLYVCCTLTTNQEFLHVVGQVLHQQRGGKHCCYFASPAYGAQQSPAVGCQICSSAIVGHGPASIRLLCSCPKQLLCLPLCLQSIVMSVALPPVLCNSSAMLHCSVCRPMCLELEWRASL